MPPTNLLELEALAQHKLPSMVFDYFASGAMDELTLRENRAAWDRIQLQFRVLQGVGTRELATQVLGTKLACPVMVAPMAFQKMAHPQGELAMAQGASAQGIPLVLSTLSTVSVEEVVAACETDVWFQLYIYKDRGLTQALVQRAEAAGCKALVLTVDAPLIGRRERDVKNGFHVPKGIVCENLRGSGMEQILPAKEDSGLAAYVADAIEPNLGWQDLAWLLEQTRLPVVVKGVCHSDDARQAEALGVKGIIVSNHGGRQLDGAPATIDVLPEIAQSVEIDVLVDGGIRRGSDVVKALARGATAVLVGRPMLWALAWDGEAGVRWALEHLRGEVDLCMALCGCADVNEVGSSLEWRPNTSSTTTDMPSS